MLVSTAAAVALHCSRCGKIEMHDVSRFALKGSAGRTLVCSCGQIQATVAGASRRQLLLEIPCLVCAENHIVPVAKLTRNHAVMERLYCVREHFELGFAGDRQLIERAIEHHRREAERSAGDGGMDAEVDNPRVMFELLNTIHDIAERGGVHCGCGGRKVEVRILPARLELYCPVCNGRLHLKAEREQDLAAAAALPAIELIPQRHLHRGH